VRVATTIRELSGLKVTVDEVIYMPTLDAPADRPHPFVYFISIHNGSDETVTIRGRKWVVREDAGETVVVEGAGVVGQSPEILPGKGFSYNSYHVARGSGQAEGAFFAETASGERVLARIPVFRMEVPE
jgi:ApaG protein